MGGLKGTHHTQRAGYWELGAGGGETENSSFNFFSLLWAVDVFRVYLFDTLVKAMGLMYFKWVRVGSQQGRGAEDGGEGN